MKKITLGALDYGVAFSVNKTLLDLLDKARLSAVGCLVTSDLWTREFKPLKEMSEQVGKRGMIGLNIALTGAHLYPLSKRMHTIYDGKMFSRFHLDRRARMRLLPDEIIQEEIRDQISAFIDKMEFEPAFIAVREGLMERTVILSLLLNAIEELGLASKPDLVAPIRPGLQAARLRRIAEKRGFRMLPWGRPLPEIADQEDLQKRLKYFFDGMSDGTFVASLPGVADDRLRRNETLQKIQIRECQAEVLGSDRFFRTLMEKDVFLF